MEEKNSLDYSEEEERLQREVINEVRSESSEIVHIPNLEIHQHGEALRVRYEKVATMLLQGYTSRQIMDKFAKEWGIERDSVRVNYIQATRKLMQNDVNLSFDEMVTDIWMKYDYIYKRFMEEDNTWGMKATLDAKLRMLTNTGMTNDDLGPVRVIEISITKPPEDKDEE